MKFRRSMHALRRAATESAGVFVRDIPIDEAVAAGDPLGAAELSESIRNAVDNFL